MSWAQRLGGHAAVHREVEWLLHFGPNDSVDGADTGHSVIVTNAFCQEPVPDLPSKHCRVLPLVVPYLLHHLGGGHLGLGAPYHSRPNAASLVVPTPIENPPTLPNKQVRLLNMDLTRASVPSVSPEERCETETCPSPTPAQPNTGFLSNNSLIWVDLCCFQSKTPRQRLLPRPALCICIRKHTKISLVRKGVSVLMLESHRPAVAVSLTHLLLALTPLLCSPGLTQESQLLSCWVTFTLSKFEPSPSPFALRFSAKLPGSS